MKRRKAKRRPTDDPENWDLLFECGTDYFNNLGFGYGPEATAPANEAAREAWRRFGAAFLANRPANTSRPVPLGSRDARRAATMNGDDKPQGLATLAEAMRRAGSRALDCVILE
jgi:hypothetical protein